MPSKQSVPAGHRISAWGYDLVTKCYDFGGFAGRPFRPRAVECLDLKRGDFVVELGCGTGLNFPLILEKIGTEGRLVGVDLSSKMLARARERVDRASWKNVTLVESDIETYRFPEGVDRVLSVGVFGCLRDPERVIKAIAQALVPGGRLVIMDGKKPDHWSAGFFHFMVRISHYFGGNCDHFKKRPWESVDLHFKDTVFRQMGGGLVYVSAGVR